MTNPFSTFKDLCELGKIGKDLLKKQEKNEVT